MDASISDILASVTRAHEAAVANINGLPLASETKQQQEDLQQLTSAWVSERMAPELLPYPTELMHRVMEKLRAQIENIEDLTARMDAGTSFALVVMQTELERFRFLVRSLLRTRIAKIDAHPHHLLAIPPDSKTRLSASEAQYLQAHASLLERHYNTSFLSSFPSKLRRLDDRAGAGGVGMVEGPDLDQAVFVRCLGTRRDGAERRRYDDISEDMDDDNAELEAGNFESVEVNCGFTADTDIDEDQDMRGAGGASGERRVLMRRGEVWLMRWSAVKEAFERGECELV